VRSIVGRFLEHSRMFYFENGGSSEVYLGSADWMPRNLYERVEVLFPLKDEALRERICKEILPAYLADNRKARVLGSNGQYTSLRNVRGGKGFSVQEHLMKLAGGFVNGSRKLAESQHKVADTPGGTGTVPPEQAQTLDLEVQDSSNATV
jgi:polyphosphate kinase